MLPGSLVTVLARIACLLVSSCLFTGRVLAGNSHPANHTFQSALPERLLLVYPGWGICDETIENAIRNGANVVSWSFGQLVRGRAGEARVLVKFDIDCVRSIANRYTGVHHLLSFGGWNSPHPEAGLSAQEYFRAWERLNKAPENARKDGSPLFDGVDWDFEGNDKKSSPTNTISRETLDIIGQFSLFAKTNGYIASLAPAESYLDPRSSAGRTYSRKLLYDDRAWEAEFAREQGSNYSRPFFGYHGRNSWAYLLVAYGWTAFDFVSVQFYESYSHFGYHLQVSGVPLQQAIQDSVNAYFDGWEVDFSTDHDPVISQLGTRFLSIPPKAFLFGIAALPGDMQSNLPAAKPPYKKIFTLDPGGRNKAAFQNAQRRLKAEGRQIRGFMFWCAKAEAQSSSPYYMSRGLADAMQLPARQPHFWPEPEPLQSMTRTHRQAKVSTAK